MSKIKQVVVIGAGFSGLAAAALIAKEGYAVTLLEKNNQPGGRARVWEKDGFRFDMGPSWYWMPEVFENYFALFGKKSSDFYELQRLDPGYRIYWEKDDALDIPASMSELEALFESIEPGAANNLKIFLAQAGAKYRTGMGEYVFKPGHSAVEFFDLDLIKKSFNLQLLTNMSKHIRKYFKHPKLIQLLEFPVLFLGATPQKIPSLYSLMNYADLVLGTWYPMGGMYQIVNAMVRIAEEQGVKINLDTEVTRINIKNSCIVSVSTNQVDYPADMVIANADYEYVDQHLIDEPYRNYSKKYWNTRTLSPSCLIWFIGTNKKIPEIQHHNLFFDEDFEQHAKEIYTDPKWPEKPLFYVCCSSKTDDSIAPKNGENLFFLMPVAPGIEDQESIREQYLELMLSRFEKVTGQAIRDNIVLKRSYALKDFKNDYHSFKGNAYGLANTLTQTAFLKPAIKSKKIKNLLHTGQLTVPGPGVPPAIISGQVVAKEALKYLKQ